MGASSRKYLLGDGQNLEIFSLVWLDATVNSTTENINVRQQLQNLINQFKTFDNTHDCLQYIRSIPRQNRVILIVSGRLGREIVPRIHRLRQVSSIYVYCMDKQKNEQWTPKFPKIKGVIVNLDELVSQIRSDRARRSICEIDEPLSFNVYKKSPNNEQSTTDSNNQFIHSELLIDCLLHMKSDPTDKSELISICKDLYKGNKCELTILDEFEQTYTSHNALWWYRRDSFVARLLNKAFQAQTIDLLYIFRFFLRDMYDQLQLNQCLTPIRAYRSQFFSIDELQRLKNSIGGLISINLFLSASTNRQKAVKYLTESDESPGVLLEIDADPRLNGMKPFGSTAQDDEILFMVGSIFRINDIQHQSDGLAIIQMTLCADNDPQLKSIFKPLKSDTKDDQMNMLSFGDVLWRMGKLTEAERYYQRLLNEATDDKHIVAECYYALGNIAMEKDDCQSSFQWHEKSLDLKKQIFEENDPSIADSYSSMADIERKQGNATQALESYTKALDIWTHAYGEDHPKIAMCLNNIGCIHGAQKNYLKTFECHEKALKIMEKHFPSDHLCLGQTHNNIGSVHRYLGNYELALEHYQISVQIKTKSFSSKHPSIASTYNNMACVYEEMNVYQQALVYYQKAATIYRHIFPPTYPDNIRITEDIQRITSKLK